MVLDGSFPFIEGDVLRRVLMIKSREWILFMFDYSGFCTYVIRRVQSWLFNYIIQEERE